MAKVVSTITGADMAELRARRDADVLGDLIELRLDGVRDLDVAGALEGRRVPAIVTCRPVWEGGRFDGSEDERLAVLAAAARAGAEFVNLEWRADERARERCRPSRLVLSHHDFGDMPGDLADRVRAMRGIGADVVKVAVTVQSLRDCTALKRAVEGDDAHVAIAMGPKGQLTRAWPAWCGSCWMYGGDAAPGQMSPGELVHSYRVRTTTASTTPYAVVGCPVGHSASPAMHNAAFAALGLDAVYVPVDTSSAEDFFAAVNDLGLAGASVTTPMKQALLTAAVEVDDLSRRIGALNTLRRGAAGWEGRNFDVNGLLAPLDRRALPLAGRRAMVLGAGGAARAAAYALTSRGATVAVSARRADRARALAEDLGVSVEPWPPSGAWDVLVNATTVGMWPRDLASPVEASALADMRGKVVYDLVYHPEETMLLRLARAAGADVVGGLEMLVSQAARQFEWWVGRQAPAPAMLEAARAFIQSKISE